MITYCIFQSNYDLGGNPCRDFCSYLRYYDIHTDGNFNTDLIFKLNYQKQGFTISYEKLSSINYHAFRVISNYTVCTNSQFLGFFKFIEDWMSKKDKDVWKTFEFISEDELQDLLSNYYNRFLDRQSLCSYEPIHSLDLIKKDNKLDIIEKQTYSDDTFKSISIKITENIFWAWKHISDNLDYDGWDMTTLQFIPIKAETLKTEAFSFESLYKLKPFISNMEIGQEDKILRLSKSVGYDISYLILKNDKLNFLEYRLYCG